MRISTRVVVAAVVATPLVLAGCGGAPPPTTTNAGGAGASAPQTDKNGKVTCADGSPGVTGDAIRFGVNAELSGGAALSGANAKRSLDMAVDDINKAGGILGKKVQVVYEDNQSSNPGAVNALNKTLTADNVFAVIGPIRSNQVQAETETIKGANVPMMIGGTNPTLTDNGGGLLFRFRPPDSLTGKSIVAFAEKKFSPKKIAVIHDSDAFGSAGAGIVEQNASKDGIKVQKFSYTTGDKDFTAQLTGLKSFAPDVIVTYATNSEDVAVFARQMNELGITAPVVGSPSVTSQVTFKLGGEYIQKWYAVVDFLLNSNPVNQKWAAEYEQRYNQQPDLYGAWQRDAMYFMKAALEKSGCSRPAFLDAMHQVNIDGVQGPLKAQKNGDVNQNLLVVQVQGDKAVKVQDVKDLLNK
jgi:branched-chain amino acid transport system substrate-binding protein